MLPLRVRLYSWGITGVGLAVLAGSIPRVRSGNIPEVLFLAACAVLLEVYSVVLPSGKHFSLASVFVSVALMQLGPGEAIMVDFLSGMVVYFWIFRSMAVTQKLFNLGQYLLSTFVLGAVYTALGGHFGHWGLNDIPALLVASLAYEAVNLLLLSVVIRLHSGRPLFQCGVENVKEYGLGFLGAAVISSPIAYSFERSGWFDLAIFCLLLMAFRYAVNLYNRMKNTYFETIGQLAELHELKSSERGGHAASVALLCQSVGTRLGLPVQEVELIQAAALLHDVGEMKLDSRLFNRRGTPTQSSLDEYKRHSDVGADLISRISGMERAVEIVRHHHERWDGQGYPEGLAGNSIPLGARILAVAEALDDWASARQRRPSAEEIVQYLELMAGTAIDPNLVGPFKEALAEVGSAQESLESKAAAGTISAIYEQVEEAVRRSQLLENLGLGQILTYRDGGLTDQAGLPFEAPFNRHVQALAERCLKSGSPARDHVVNPGAGTVFDIYCIPNPEGTAMILLFDVTEVLKLEREQLRRTKKAYSDVIYAVTKGKLHLVEETEARAISSQGELLGSVDLGGRTGAVKEVRDLMRQTAQTLGLQDTDLFRTVLCASEAVTNAIKHAEKGWVQVRSTSDAILLVVGDNGGGIPLEILPKAVLMEGFSTKVSLGKGYNLMVQYMDGVILSTSPNGTILILRKDLKARKITSNLELGGQVCSL